MRNEGEPSPSLPSHSSFLIPHPCRLITLTGPGGSGKTRLAIAVAGRLEDEFTGGPSTLPSGARSGGPWFVPLAELTEPHLIPDAIISDLGLTRAGHMDPWEQVVAALQEQRSLLVLDNFGQLVEAGAGLLRVLLERVPTLTCLVTSRRRLELEGELECVVLPLPTPVERGKLRVESPPGAVRSDLSTLNSPLLSERGPVRRPGAGGAARLRAHQRECRGSGAVV
jgi:hypothetical protein